MALKIIFNPFLQGNFQFVTTAVTPGFTIETPTGLVNASNTTFTPSAQPYYVVADGITYFAGAGYTWSSPNIVMDVPPSQYIKDAV